MWIMTDFGFFSIVQKPDDLAAGTLTVRSRAREDLENLQTRFSMFPSTIIESAETDYRIRLKMKAKDLAVVIGATVQDISYSNFKSRVSKSQGHARAHVYSDVWAALLPLQSTKAKKATPPKTSISGSSGKIAAGGVLIDPNGKILLREPANHFDGYVWTFAKGKVDKGETPETAALREVKEETGYEAQIAKRIPGEFKGGTGVTVYFLMHPKGEPGKYQWETQSVRWATFEEARELIKKTTNNIGRERDLAVLEAAKKLGAD